MSQKYIFGQSYVNDDAGTITLAVYEFDGERRVDMVENVCVPKERVAETIIELVASYDFVPMRLSEVLPSSVHSLLADFPKQFSGIQVIYDTVSDEFVAQIKNGDTGAHDLGHGSSAAGAVADLARSHGFKSKLPDDGAPSLEQWFTDFQYGFNRISDELLRSEMDAIFAPEKGAW